MLPGLTLAAALLLGLVPQARADAARSPTVATPNQSTPAEVVVTSVERELLFA